MNIHNISHNILHTQISERDAVVVDLFTNLLGVAVCIWHDNISLQLVRAAFLHTDRYSRPQRQSKRRERFLLVNLCCEDCVIRDEPVYQQRRAFRKFRVRGRTRALLMLHAKRKVRLAREFGQHYWQITRRVVEICEPAFVWNGNKEESFVRCR